MSRQGRSAVAVAVAAAVALLGGAAGARPATARSASSAQGTGGDVRFDIRDLAPDVRDMRASVMAMDGSVTDTRTQKQVELTLAADVFFAFDKAELTVPAAISLAELAPRVADEARGTVRIDGYTDAKGGDAYNVELSQRRAAAVRADLERRLTGRGLTLEATGRGATNFVAPNANPDGSDNPEGRARNRRVTITYDR
jgi:outer membrane protein OmpA-like peptidoglycan-associated protein